MSKYIKKKVTSLPEIKRNEKPKTSTLNRMSESDKALFNRLVVLCGNYYHKIAYPSKPGPHSNPDELDAIKKELLLMSLRVGERVWYPRG